MFAMKDEDKRIIREQIAPLVQNGDVALFLGAGFSIGTPSINNKSVPSSPGLVNRICEEAGYKEEAEYTDLPTAFGLGEDEIDNFENFLISNFTVTEPEIWQCKVFQYWWRTVFTTNIDTIAESAIRKNNLQNSSFPGYRVFNYSDREPVQSLPTEPPVVYLHGMVSRPVDGFVFDNVSYAENTVNQGDWLSKCSLHISHGNCLFVGSKFKESDIETALRRRKVWEGENHERENNWIVLRSFSEIERRSYAKRGITPIEAEAKEFFEYLFGLIGTLSQKKFIKRKAPYLSDMSDNKSSSWFSKNMASVSVELQQASVKRGPYSLFYNGDMPDWFYVYNEVPTEFHSYRTLLTKILDFENSGDKVMVLPVLGPLGSGKSTCIMQALSKLSSTHNNIYQYVGLDGINIDYAWRVIKDLKGLVVIYVDASSSYFYAINDIIYKVLNNSSSSRVCVVLEERTLQYERNKRHFVDVPRGVISPIYQENIDRDEAALLLDKTSSLGISFEKLKGLDRKSSIDKIVNFDNGYNGDLLATLYDLSSRKSYKEQLNEEYEEILGEKAKDIFETISLVSASRLSIPVNYLSEIHSISVDKLMEVIKDQLNGKVSYRGASMTVGARHHSIAEYHLSNNFDKKSLRDRIISLMKCLSGKFSIEDIKKHPISYKIYSKIMSYHYLTETLFKGKENYEYVHEIYSYCQTLFYDDGIFWLQYGRFLERDGNVSEALHCFRKGLELYDSFQLRHALGHLLLKKYRLDKVHDDSEFEEGVKLLQYEIDSRGANDGYPYTAMGNELIRIYNSGMNQDKCATLLKSLINRGLQIHREDSHFTEMVGRYFKTFKNAKVH